MKKPIFNFQDRMLMREYPDTLFAQGMKLDIAKLHFWREVERVNKRDIKRIGDFFKKITNKIWK